MIEEGSRAKRVARGYGARIDGSIDDQQAVCPPVPLPEQEKEGESVSPSEAGVGGLKKVDSVETDMCKRFLGEGFMMNQRSCDSSACLICARPGNDAPLKRYVDDSDLRPSTSRDALSHIFRSLSPSQKEGERMVARMPALDSSTRGTKQGGRSVTELYASSSGGENDHNPGSPRGKLEFSDQLVPQSAVTERQECYRVRESDRDNRDKVIASMDFRSVGGFFASATSCKELCIHRLAQAEGDGESFVAHRQSVDPRWVHRTSAKLSSLAWNNNANVITVGDHYGELTRVDVETCHILTETDEGSGTAVLDLKRNRHFGTTCLLTATKSGAVKLWTEDLSESLELTDECVDRVPICGVAFSPVNPNWVAAARSDSVVTLYDIRHGAAPLWRRRMGGTNAVAHLDHLASGDLVCSQLNEGISVWRRSGQGEDGKIEMARRMHAYASHTQTKHFVGLSVSSRGFIATGSECGRAYVYGSRISEPVALCSSDPTLGDSGVTAVEWIPQDQCEGDSQGLLVAQGASINRFKIDIPAL